jgi:hypothetical protein
MLSFDGRKENLYMFLTMKRNVILILAACLVFTIAVFALAANAQKGEKKGGSKTVTGCLQKGDEADEFSLTGDDGKLYGLRSSSVKLADHVGHKVTVSGSFKAEGQEKDEDEAKESKEGGNKEAGDIQVKSLKMLGSSCQ